MDVLTCEQMNPFIAFCLYVAARVFVQYLKSRPKDTQIKSSLQFLLSAMQAIKRKNPLTESFLVQLDVDLEGAGLHEASESIRKQMQHPIPGHPTRSEGCPVSQLGVGEGHTPSYGELGVGAYNEPSTDMPATTTTAPPQQQQPAFTYENLTPMSGSDNIGFVPSMNANSYELPVRSPASHQSQSSGMQHKSPQSFGAEMDTSPEHHTPNSSSHQSGQGLSTHTSHTGYSPQNMASPGRLTGPSLFEPNDGTFTTTDFDMATFQPNTVNNQDGFVLPANWGSGGTGFTPGPTGFTPGPTGLTPGPSGMPDMMNMSDAEFNQLMSMGGFSNDVGWDTGQGHGELKDWMGARRL